MKKYRWLVTEHLIEEEKLIVRKQVYTSLTKLCVDKSLNINNVKNGVYGDKAYYKEWFQDNDNNTGISITKVEYIKNTRDKNHGAKDNSFKH